MQKLDKLVSFEEAVLPHLSSAYNLARWLTRNEADAEDVVQEAYLRAFKFFRGFHGTDGRRWLLGIVRNTCYTWMQQNRSPELNNTGEDELNEIESKDLDPEALLLQSADTQIVRQALEELPIEFREVLVLRELEEMSYKEIASLAELPLGTVMSRLARGRKRRQPEPFAGRPVDELAAGDLHVDRPVEDDEQVEVGKRAEVPPAVAAGGDERGGPARRPGVLVKPLQPAVHVRGIAGQRGHAAFAGEDVPADVPARVFERRGESAIRRDVVTVHAYRS